MALTDNLLSYWKFDESSGNAADSSGNSKTLTNVNTAAYAAGKINNGADLEITGGAKYFSRSNDVYDVTEGTVTAWLKIESNPGNRQGVIGTATGAGVAGFLARLNNTDNKLDFFFGGGSNPVQTTVSLSAATFYFIAWTWSTTDKKVYINASLDNTNGTDETMGAGDTTLYVGTDSTSTANSFDGIIDEVGVWSRALSGAEILQLYNGGDGLSYPFTRALTMAAGIGSFVFVGNDAAVNRAIPSLVAGTGSYVLAGNDISFSLRSKLNEAKHSATPVNQSKNSAVLTNESKSF